MKFQNQEILLREEKSEGIPDYQGGATHLAVGDGILALNPTVTPNKEVRENEIASSTFDTGADEIGIESGEVGFSTYLRGGKVGDPSVLPYAERALRACSMQREQLTGIQFTADVAATFAHGETVIAVDGAAQAVDIPNSVLGVTTRLRLPATHSLAAGVKIPIIVENGTLTNVPDAKKLEGAYWATAVATADLDIDFDTSNTGAVLGACNVRLPVPFTGAGGLNVIPGAKTKIRFIGATGTRDWAPTAAGQTMQIVLSGIGVTGTGANPAALEGVFDATFVAEGGSGATAYSEFEIDVDSTGWTYTSPSGTAWPVVSFRAVGEIAVVANQFLPQYDTKGVVESGMVFGGLLSKAIATAAAAPTDAKGWRYRPTSRSTQVIETGPWGGAGVIGVGEVFRRRGECNAYGAVLSVELISTGPDRYRIEFEKTGTGAILIGDYVSKVGADDQLASVLTTAEPASGPSVTIEARVDGLLVETYSGARGTFTITLDTGGTVKINYTFSGLKYKDSEDWPLAGVPLDTSGVTRFLNGVAKYRNLDAKRRCDFDLDVSSMTFDIGNEVVQRTSPFTPSGARAYAVNDRTPQLTADPELVLNGIHPFFKHWSQAKLLPILAIAGKDVGNRVAIWSPATQYSEVGVADRNKTAIANITGLCKQHESGDDSLQIFFF
ncbi:MAG: hypothetical protein KDC95_09795 [Planctomycetes bacterium]|nr:hypothetical protein [Planctomycetota bacterium]